MKSRSQRKEEMGNEMSLFLAGSVARSEVESELKKMRKES